MKKILFLFVFGGILGCHSTPEFKSGLEGKVLPNFSMLLVDSTTYLSTKSISTDQPIVFVYFSPYCPFCRAEIKEILQNINNLARIRFYLLTPWSFREMKEFYNHFQLYKYPNLTTGIDYSNFFEPYFHVTGLPYTAIYEKRKILSRVFVGEIKGYQIEETIKK